MVQEFEKIMEFFSLPAEEKEERLGEIFEESIEFFEKFKYVMLNGSEEEKKTMMEQVQKLQAKLQEETENVKQTTGLSDEELEAYAQSPDNFKEEDWSIIQNARASINKQAEEITELFGGESVKESPKKSPRARKSKKKWMKS